MELVTALGALTQQLRLARQPQSFYTAAVTSRVRPQQAHGSVIAVIIIFFIFTAINRRRRHPHHRCLQYQFFTKHLQ